jgi:hypothetical protein
LYFDFECDFYPDFFGSFCTHKKDGSGKSGEEMIRKWAHKLLLVVSIIEEFIY